MYGQPHEKFAKVQTQKPFHLVALQQCKQSFYFSQTKTESNPISIVGAAMVILDVEM